MSQEVRAGIVAVLFVIALAGALLFLRGGINFRERGYLVHIIVPNAGGLVVGAPVQLAGVEIGRVIGVELTPERRVRITARIQGGVQIPTGSRFSLGTLGLLGDRYVVIIPEPGDVPPIDPGTVVTGSSPVAIEEIVERVVAVARRAEDALTNLNRIIGDPTLSTALRDTVTNAREATAVMRRAAENIERGTKALDRTVTAEIPAIASDLQKMAASLAAAADDARVMVRDVSGDGQTARQARQAVASLQRAADGIEKMVHDLQGLVNEREIQAVKASLDQAKNAIGEADRAVQEGREAIAEGRAVIKRADQTIQQFQRAIPERLEPPPLRTIARLDYTLWYQGSRLSNDLELTLQPLAPTNFFLVLRDIGFGNLFGIQVGNRLSSQFRIRYGIIDSFLGVAMDYRAAPPLSLSAELYNVSQPSMNIYLRYALADHYGLALRAQGIFQQTLFGVGGYYRF